MRDHSESCSEIRAHLPLYVGGDLDAPVLSSVSEHLNGCAACGEVLRSAEAARGALVEVRTPAGPDLWPGLRDRLRTAGLFRSEDEAGATRPTLRTMVMAEGAPSGPGGPNGDLGERTAARPVTASGSRSRFHNSWWAGLGTVAAAAAIVGVVWLGEPSTTAPADNGTTTGSAPTVVSNDGMEAAARVEAREEVFPVWNEGTRVADAGPVAPVSDPQAEPPVHVPVRATLRPVRPLTSPAVTLAGYDGPSGLRTLPAGNRRQLANELPTQDGPPRTGGLRLVGEDEERLLAEEEPPQRRGILFFVPLSPMGPQVGGPQNGTPATDGQAQPPRHKHIR